MNIYDIPDYDKREEYTEVLKEFDSGKIERIISEGQTTDWMIQDENEYVILIKGEAEIEYENRKLRLKEGDTVFIPEGEKHRVSYTSSGCLWICIFFS